MSREKRQAENQVRARSENRARGLWFLRFRTVALRCECDKLDCEATIPVTVRAYRRIRSSPIQFAVSPGHYAPEVERIIKRHAKYWVSEKVGVGADVAREEAARPLPPDTAHFPHKHLS